MNRVLTFYNSSIGKKVVMAFTGLIGFGYVVAHMVGNLQVFEGPAKLNAYAAFLKSNMALLWGVRSLLLIAVLLHIVSSYQLARMSMKSRPMSYHRWRPVASNYASRTMRWSGPIIGLFIIYHLLHLTTGTVHPYFQELDVYANVIAGFRVWYASAIYIVAMLALGLHLYHGAWSMFQSLGINHPQYNGLIRGLATIITIIVVIGFISIPVAVLLGFLS